MDLLETVRRAMHHGMRAYYIAVLAGALLVISAFLPWMLVGEVRVGGVPDPAGLWVLGLGLTAIVLAGLSIWTRKNSRHPLLVVGLTSLGILFLAYRWLSRVVAEAAWARAQARAIVDNVAPEVQPAPTAGWGVYLGLAASSVLVLFGLTVVVRRASHPYLPPEEDDEIPASLPPDENHPRS